MRSHGHRPRNVQDVAHHAGDKMPPKATRDRLLRESMDEYDAMEPNPEPIPSHTQRDRGALLDRGDQDRRGDTSNDPILDFDPTVTLVPCKDEYDSYEGTGKLRFHDRRVRFDPSIPDVPTVKKILQREMKYKSEYHPEERDPFAHTRDSPKTESIADERGVQTDHSAPIQDPSTDANTDRPPTQRTRPRK